jgi:hypothetical protein
MGANNAFRRPHVGSEPYALGESIPPAVFVLFFSLRLGRTKENKLSKFSNRFNATPTLDALVAGLATRPNNKTIDDVRGVLDEPWYGRVSKWNFAAES